MHINMYVGLLSVFVVGRRLGGSQHGWNIIVMLYNWVYIYIKNPFRSDFGQFSEFMFQRHTKDDVQEFFYIMNRSNLDIECSGFY